MEKYCYLNGKIIETKNAKISINDIGILRGFGCFDFLRTYNGVPFLFNDHLRRFFNSANLMNLKPPISADEIKKIVGKLIIKNKAKNVGIRILLTGGYSFDGFSWNKNKPTFAILMQKLHLPDKKLYRDGIKLITYDYQRELPLAKTNNYATKLKLDSFRQEKKAFEILYLNNGNILEGASCNFFIFKNDVLITPKDDILLGTRRRLIINLAKKFFKVEERTLKLGEINEASEAFVSSTTRDILPVVKIDNINIGNGKVGNNTKKLIELYKNYVKENE